ncbi:spermine oxidase-like [Culicoides brevitarsis]|uniref:spermine oxidase-like n=1 Tax=Culicoides brevitarsis TaxID=469753 RepID=UPI00307C8E82
MSNPKVISESTYADIVNAGAQWLHGKENKLYELAKNYNLLSNELSEEGLGAYLRNDGMRFNDYLVKKVDFIVGQILEDCEEFAQSNSDDFPTSMGAFLLQEFEKRLNEFETPEDQRLAKQLLDWHIRFQIIDNSCLTIDDVSAKSWGTYSFNGESCQAHINFKTCFSDILAILMMEIGPYHMLCENKVEKIAWGIHTDGQKIQQSTPPKVIVKCENGNIFIAKHVICTFSLGVLKETANEMFAPKIPEKHLQAINSMGFGTIDKIYLQFSEPFWGNEKGIQLIYEDPNYENADWTRMISGFDVLEPGPKNTLLGWIGGTGAIEMEKLRDEEIIDKVTQLLEKFMKQQIPKPIKYHVTRWHSNPNVRGAYSYVSKECDATQISPKTLAMPIFYKDLNNKRPSSDTNCDNCPQILFAGEACHEQYYSTAHGAFLSGAEQAEKIIEFRNLFAEKENCGKI